MQLKEVDMVEILEVILHHLLLEVRMDNHHKEDNMEALLHTEQVNNLLTASLHHLNTAQHNLLLTDNSHHLNLEHLQLEEVMEVNIHLIKEEISITLHLQSHQHKQEAHRLQKRIRIKRA